MESRFHKKNGAIPISLINWINLKNEKMKKLRKVAFVIILIAANYSAFAQTIRVNAGLNISSIAAKDPQGNTPSDWKSALGFHIGGAVVFPLTEMLSFEPGIQLTTKGRIIDQDVPLPFPSTGTYNIKSTLKLYYIDIPLNLRATYSIGNIKLFGTFGPYVGMGISGKVKTKVTGFPGSSNPADMKIKWGSGNSDDLKRLDYGINIGAGAEMKSFSIGFSYGYGFADIFANPSGDESAKNRVIQVSLGYTIGGK